RKNTADKKTSGKSRDTVENAEALEEDNDSDGSSKAFPAPTKTKAQQKMFSDLPNQSGSPSCARKFHTREFRVRLRRLTQSEIDAASTSVAKSKFYAPAPRKRGRPRKSDGDEKNSPSPSKKLKTTPTSNFHIKVPVQSGAQNRALLSNLARIHTPPPILSTRPKSKPKPRSPFKGLKVSPTMIRRYGKRVFSCVVKVKNLKWPSNSPERNSRPRLGGVRKVRPRRSNLSVSFNESVEILGTSESGSPRSTFGTISSKLPKPTRLQRVDATGNVLEDIALTSNMVLSGNSPSASTSGSRGKGNKRRSRNGSPQLKRPHQRIPLSGLASLRLDDGPKSDDDDEEYIVPNELPGMQRPGTPTPRKKKISYTTTVSDDEDDKAPPKKSKDANSSKTKPNPKKVDKSTSLKESVLQNVILSKTNEIIKEKEAAVAEDQVAETEVQTALEAAINEEKDGEEPETSKPVDMAEDSPQEAEETPVETGAGGGEKSGEETGEEDAAEESKPSAKENGEKNREEESSANAEHNAAEASESLDTSSRQYRDDKAEQAKVDDVDDFRGLDTPPLQQLPLMTDENPDDILENQTSLEDVQRLHTPFSSQLSTPQAAKRVRLDSMDSDCSFKSANEQNKDAHVLAEGDKPSGEEDAAAGEDKSEIDTAATPTLLTTPPPSTPRTVNGCDPATNDGSGITAVCFSPIEAMPTLDDEVLGQLVGELMEFSLYISHLISFVFLLSEPDFQLNSSRHAISRGTLDDIMTALES
ncbi:hypothetical protein KR032_001219, partial [Drosophila birchii]